MGQVRLAFPPDSDQLAIARKMLAERRGKLTIESQSFVKTGQKDGFYLRNGCIQPR
jgi:hypothetical protein